MEPDYKHEGKQLLLRALTAMVEDVEMSATEHFGGDEIVSVYRALVFNDEDNKKVAADAISSGISDALLKSIMSN